MSLKRLRTFPVAARWEFRLFTVPRYGQRHKLVTLGIEYTIVLELFTSKALNSNRNRPPPTNVCYFIYNKKKRIVLEFQIQTASHSIVHSISVAKPLLATLFSFCKSENIQHWEIQQENYIKRLILTPLDIQKVRVYNATCFYHDDPCLPRCLKERSSMLLVRVPLRMNTRKPCKNKIRLLCFRWITKTF